MVNLNLRINWKKLKFWHFLSITAGESTVLTWLLARIRMWPMTGDSGLLGFSMLRFANACSPKIDRAYMFAAMKPHWPDSAWNKPFLLNTYPTYSHPRQSFKRVSYTFRKLMRKEKGTPIAARYYVSRLGRFGALWFIIRIPWTVWDTSC